MTALPRSPRAALIAAFIGLAAVHAPAFATRDLPIVVQVCPKEGRDPSAALLIHSCGVWSPDDLAATPSWNVLELMAVDANTRGGGVVATLHCMSRTTGVVSAVARVQSEPSDTRPKTVAARLTAPLDFGRCGYLVRIDTNSTTAPAQALMVTLRN